MLLSAAADDSHMCCSHVSLPLQSDKSNCVVAFATASGVSGVSQVNFGTTERVYMCHEARCWVADALLWHTVGIKAHARSTKRETPMLITPAVPFMEDGVKLSDIHLRNQPLPYYAQL